MKTIVEIAVESGKFNTLVSAVKAANLVETLSGEGPFTVFAPTDEAFSKLPAGTLEELLNDIPKLTEILKYHVVSGKVMSGDLSTKLAGGRRESVETVQGKNVTLEMRGVFRKNIYVNDAKVVQADIEGSNGVIHVIDKVILPPMIIA